jgi:hypothetical protein
VQLVKVSLRLGFVLDLDGPFSLPQPLTGAELTPAAGGDPRCPARARRPVSGSLSFPFFWWPAASSALCSTTSTSSPPNSSASSPELAQAWTRGRGQLNRRPGRACSARTTVPRRSATDPALVERGLRGHADTQNELARVLRDGPDTPVPPAARTELRPGLAGGRDRLDRLQEVGERPPRVN